MCYNVVYGIRVCDSFVVIQFKMLPDLIGMVLHVVLEVLIGFYLDTYPGKRFQKYITPNPFQRVFCLIISI